MLDEELADLRKYVLQLEKFNAENSETVHLFKSQLEASQQYAQELEEKIRLGEAHRRKLHNTVQELKGNIRVFCRVRPLRPQECNELYLKESFKHILFSDIDEHEITLVQSYESATGKLSTKSFPFSFDKVFKPESTQEQIFEEISHLIQSALDGYRVCIFA
jgi:kinesin family protein C1